MDNYIRPARRRKTPEQPEDSGENRIFIVDHPCCELLFGSELNCKIYEWNDEELFNPESQKDSVDFSRRFSEGVNRIIADRQRNIVFMPFHPEVLRELEGMAEKLRSGGRGVWSFFAFFHRDDDTQFLYRKEGELPIMNLDLKAEWILTMGQFPFVHMAEAGCCEIMSWKRLTDLFREYN
jgi:hypothetical protein